MEQLPDIRCVIVADDDPMIRSVLRAKLEGIDQTVLLASDGAEAVELAARTQAALIMLDLSMPRLNGLLACQRIRLMPHNAGTPIVILTSTHGKDAETACARVGATTFLTKPFRTAQLLQVLARFLPMNADTRITIRQNADRANEIAGPAATMSRNRLSS